MIESSSATSSNSVFIEGVGAGLRKVTFFPPASPALTVRALPPPAESQISTLGGDSPSDCFCVDLGRVEPDDEDDVCESIGPKGVEERRDTGTDLTTG